MKGAREGRGGDRARLGRGLNAVPEGCGGGCGVYGVYGVSEELSWDVLFGLVSGELGDSRDGGRG